MLEMIKNMDIVQLATTLGYIGIIAIIFAETGIFLGFFFPGDSLLFAAGLLAAIAMFLRCLLKSK